MGKKPLTLSESIQKSLDRYNKHAQENQALYARECLKQGKKIGEPIDLMGLLK